MNARQMIAKLDGYGGIIPFNSEELEVALRALRLLAAAEANDGSIPEMTKAVQEGRGIELGCQFERERNGLAARVGELEAALLSILSAKRHDPNRGRGSEGQFVTMNIKAEIVAQADAAIDAARSKP